MPGRSARNSNPRCRATAIPHLSRVAPHPYQAADGFSTSHGFGFSHSFKDTDGTRYQLAATFNATGAVSCTPNVFWRTSRYGKLQQRRRPLARQPLRLSDPGDSRRRTSVTSPVVISDEITAAELSPLRAVPRLLTRFPCQVAGTSCGSSSNPLANPTWRAARRHRAARSCSSTASCSGRQTSCTRRCSSPIQRLDLRCRRRLPGNAGLQARSRASTLGPEFVARNAAGDSAKPVEPNLPPRRSRRIGVALEPDALKRYHTRSGAVRVAARPPQRPGADCRGFTRLLRQAGCGGLPSQHGPMAPRGALDVLMPSLTRPGLGRTPAGDGVARGCGAESACARASPAAPACGSPGRRARGEPRQRSE